MTFALDSKAFKCYHAITREKMLHISISTEQISKIFHERRGTMLFLGTFNNSIDASNRLTVPARYREEFGSEAVLFRAVEKCLNIYTTEEFSKIVDAARAGAVGAKNREKLRNFFADATTVTVDRAGRIIIPAEYMQHASLSAEVTVLGVGTHFEVWNRDTFNADYGDRDAAPAFDYPDIVL